MGRQGVVRESLSRPLIGLMSGGRTTSAAVGGANGFYYTTTSHLISDGCSPLLLLGALGQRLHVELRHVPAVLIPPQVPLWKQTACTSEGWLAGWCLLHRGSMAF